MTTPNASPGTTAGPSAAERPALELRGVEAAYGGAPALRGVSLRVPAGAAVALLGANGAGKTTTIRAITGLIGLQGGAVTEGDILIDGEPVTALKSHQIVKRGVSQVPEGRMVFANLSVEENLQIGAIGRREPGEREAMERVLDMFPVLRKRLHDHGGWMSGGEQQMLAIGRALMAAPSLMLLDEVSLGLAPLITRSIFESLAEIRRESGTSMLLVEQNASLALEFCDHAYILENGRVVHEGPAELLRGDPQVQELYLGGAPGESDRSFANAKRFRRRQRWMS